MEYSAVYFNDVGTLVHEYMNPPYRPWRMVVARQVFQELLCRPSTRTDAMAAGISANPESCLNTPAVGGLVARRFTDDVERELYNRSHRLVLQDKREQSKLLSDMFKESIRVKKEMAALIIFQFSIRKVYMRPADESEIVRASDSHLIIQFGYDQSGRYALNQPSQRLIGDVHTHCRASNFTNGLPQAYALRVGEIVHPGISDDDIGSAKPRREYKGDSGMVVYAMDSSNLHRVNRHGRKTNNMDLDMDVVADALKTYQQAP